MKPRERRIERRLIAVLAQICAAILLSGGPASGQLEPDLEVLRQELERVRAELEEQRAIISKLKETVGRLEQASKAAKGRGAQAEQAKVVTVSTDRRPFKGDREAPVTLVEFSDFQCQYCARFFHDVLPALERDLIASGKLRFVYRHYPLPVHAHARPAAQAANCAQRQGKFWEMHDWLFAHQAALDESAFARAGRDLSLDVAAYDACRDSPEVRAEVDQDVRDAVKAGVRGTPAFVIGRSEPNGTVTGEVAVGVHSVEAIREQLEMLTATARPKGPPSSSSQSE